MNSAVRWVFPIVTGAAFLVIGSYFALHPLWAGKAPLTEARWLDMAIALACLLRGVFNIRIALGRRREALAQR